MIAIEIKQRIRLAFDDMLENFFPRWKVGQRWSVEVAGAISRCDNIERKVYISIADCSKTGDEMNMILVHEICHAVVRHRGHGITWQKKMKAVQNMVRRVGRHHLADKLGDDLIEFAASPMRIKEVYRLAKNFLVDNPRLTYEVWLSAFGLDHGLTRVEVEKYFPKMGQIFGEHIAERCKK